MHPYHECQRSLIVFSFSDEPEAERSKGTGDSSVRKILNPKEIPEKKFVEEEDEEDDNVKVDNREVLYLLEQELTSVPNRRF